MRGLPTPVDTSTSSAAVVTPALYDVHITHHREAPLRYAFAHDTTTWLVDLDDVPRLGRLVQFAARDHLGDSDLPLREKVETYLAGHGVDLAGGRILMLANPRVLGYTFNPLTLFWCHQADGRLLATVAEVHNTYGQRHVYLIEADERGLAVVDKAFYVSPFYPVDGTYRMSVPEPHETLAVTLTLHRPDDRPFVAVMKGRRRPGRARLRSALRTPLATRAVMFHIKRHGITLYLKGLRPAPRPDHPVQEHVR